MAKAATKAKETAARKGPSATMPEIVKGSLKAVLGQEGVNKTNQLLMVSPTVLRIIPGFNPRIHELDKYKEDAEELKDSIRNEGFYADKPIAGYVGKDGEEDVIFITDGHRRFEAVESLRAEGVEINTLPVVLKPAETDIARLTISTVRSNTGRRLTFFENAIVVRRLLKHGMSKAEIAKALGFTERAVEDFFIMIEAPKKVRDLVKMERVSGTEAVRILRKFKEPEKATEKLLDMVAKAEAKGKKKATREESGDAPVKAKTRGAAAAADEGDEASGEVTSARKPARKKGFVTLSVAFKGNPGDEVPIADIRNFKNLFADQGWYKLDDDRPNLVIITEEVEFVGYITRPRAAAAPEAKEVADDEDENEGGEEGEDENTEEGVEEPEDERQAALADL
jgi:ParB family transcriptional regulator, chromosome partitioning protein